MDFLKKIVTQESTHFGRLNQQGQKLIISIFLYNVVDPFLIIFTNAFLWRQSQSPQLVALYNLTYCIGLPCAFYLNGQLLRKYKPGQLYFFGNLLQGSIVALLIFFSAHSFRTITFFGLLFGLGAGFFWANRNLLTLRVTRRDNRIYFAGLESLSGTLLSIIVPILVGAFIIVGSNLHIYSIQGGYELLSLISLGVLFFVGFLLKDITITIAPISRVILKKRSSLWNMFRYLTFIYGILSGIGFLTPIIILKFIGNEGKLGVVQSFAAIISTIIIYSIAKKASQKHRIIILIVGVLLNFIGALFFGILYSIVGTFLLVTFFALANPFEWVAYSTLSNDVIDREESIHTQHHFSYVFDQEFFEYRKSCGYWMFFSFYKLFS